MPSTIWSAPSSPGNDASLVTSSFTISPALNDVSPSPCLISAGQISSATRIRLHATGSYIATTTASSITYGFCLTQSGIGISATASAVLCGSASIPAIVGTGMPFILDYSGVFNEASVAQNSTTAKVTGQGWIMRPGATVDLFALPSPMPITAAARTVTQTSTITGLNTLTNLIAQVYVIVAVNTGLTSITIDELTCELLG
jgi:hypothetical protein